MGKTLFSAIAPLFTLMITSDCTPRRRRHYPSTSSQATCSATGSAACQLRHLRTMSVWFFGKLGQDDAVDTAGLRAAGKGRFSPLQILKHGSADLNNIPSHSHQALVTELLKTDPSVDFAAGVFAVAVCRQESNVCYQDSEPVKTSSAVCSSQCSSGFTYTYSLGLTAMRDQRVDGRSPGMAASVFRTPAGQPQQGASGPAAEGPRAPKRVRATYGSGRCGVAKNKLPLRHLRASQPSSQTVPSRGSLRRLARRAGGLGAQTCIRVAIQTCSDVSARPQPPCTT